MQRSQRNASTGTRTLVWLGSTLAALVVAQTAAPRAMAQAQLAPRPVTLKPAPTAVPKAPVAPAPVAPAVTPPTVKPSTVSPATVKSPTLVPARIDASALKPATLQGWVDLHTHPMSYLGFGRKAVHGAPDVGMIVPAGTHSCNGSPRRARSMEEALGSCNSTHGGWGVDNTCGDYLRAAIVSLALDDHFKYNVGADRNLHGDHEHAGYPNFDFWPHHSSILHQQMWWEWLKRAHAGGLRVMVALTVNSETLAEVLHGDGPYDDKSVADVQIAEAKRMVEAHKDFMEVAYSAADVRRIVGGGRLAVILGMEVDKLGNFGKPGVRTDEEAVRAEIQRLYRAGVRYVFPIHLIDNAFGGTAVFSMLFNFANKHQNGYHFRVATDRNIGYSANLTDGPLGFENGLILGINGLLQGVGELPAPCFNDLIKCSPPPGKVRCCGSYESVLNILQPSPELDIYKLIHGGHVNTLGITRLGEVAINEMMRLGIIIDVDHMSDRSLRAALNLAKAVPGTYPLVMGHNELRPRNGGKERNAPADAIVSVIDAGGMFGVGSSDASPQAWLERFHAVSGLRYAGGKLPNGALALGTDVDGFERLPNNGRGDAGSTQAESRSFYDRFLRESGITTKSAKPNGKSWDYIVDGGVSHYGLMPEFLFDLKTHEGGVPAYTELMSSAEYFARMWETIEQRSKQVSSAPRAGTYPFTLAATGSLCPYKLLSGDREYGGHGPAVRGSVKLGISADGTSLQATVSFDAKETTSDWSEVQGEWTLPVGDPAPAGMRYTAVRSAPTSTFEQTLSGGGRNEVTEGCDGGEHVIVPSSGPVARLVVVGDTGGGDISGDADCNCDTRIVRIEWKAVDVSIGPR